jgi:hypothetical protein
VLSSATESDDTKKRTALRDWIATYLVDAGFTNQSFGAAWKSLRNPHKGKEEEAARLHIERLSNLKIYADNTKDADEKKALQQIIKRIEENERQGEGKKEIVYSYNDDQGVNNSITDKLL